RLMAWRKNNKLHQANNGEARMAARKFCPKKRTRIPIPGLYSFGQSNARQPMAAKNWIAMSVVVAVISLGWSVSIAPMHFRTLAHAKAEIESAGYYCVSDVHDGSVNPGGFMLS